MLTVLAVATAMAGWAAEPAPDGMATADLTEMSLEELMDIEISVASKRPESTFEAPGVVVAVPRDEIGLYGDRNLVQLLQRQPSVYTRGSYAHPNNIASFRGNMPTHVDLHTLVLFNGRPIRESGFGGINFPTYVSFPLASLDSVELVRGPGSVLYGTNAFTGVVNLKPLPVPDRREVSVSAMGGSYGYYDTTITGGGRSGDLGFIGSFRVAGRDGYTYGLTDETGVYDSAPDRHSGISGMMHLEYRQFTFDLFAVRSETFHLGPLPRWDVTRHEFHINKLFANAGYRAPVSERMDLEFNLTYNLHEDVFGGFPEGTIGLNTSDVIGEATLFANPTDNLNLVVGALQEYRSNYGPGDGHYRSIPLYEYWPRSAYAQADYAIGNTVKLIGGTQWNKPDTGSSDLIYRLGAIITPSERWGVKLLRGEAFRAPFALETTLYDVPILVGNEDLRPEEITTYDAQLFYHDDRTYAALTYFDSTINQLIIRDTSVSPASFKNGGEQQFSGIELETKRFLTSNWHVVGSAMYWDDEQTADLNPSTAPHRMVKLGTGYSWDWGTASIFYSHFGKPPRLASEMVVNPEPDALDLLSLNLRIDPSQWLRIPKGRAVLTLRVENLFDEEIHVPDFNRGGHPNSLPDGPGRTVYLGVQVNL